MNLVYMAKPTYGGWINFTVHLSFLNNSNIYKTTKRSEKNKRNFGFGLKYQNLSIQDIVKLNDITIVALDKHYYHYLHLFPKGCNLVIHDPSEIKNQNNPLIKENLINNFNVITIRKTVQKYLQNKFKCQSSFIFHPFYKYQKSNSDCLESFAISISRIDYDKNVDIILKANLILPPEKKIIIYGKENRLCVHHKLKQLNFEEYWKGKYDKTLQITYKGKDILQKCKFLIDLSTIKNDGGGTQYTFLDGIYNDCVLILHEEWANKGDLFINNYNCLTVSDEHELYETLNKNYDQNYLQNILNNSKLILEKTNIIFQCDN